MSDLNPRRDIDANDVAAFLRRHPDFLADFPDLKPEHIRAVLLYAAVREKRLSEPIVA